MSVMAMATAMAMAGVAAAAAVMAAVWWWPRKLPMQTVEAEAKN